MDITQDRFNEAIEVIKAAMRTRQLYSQQIVAKTLVTGIYIDQYEACRIYRIEDEEGFRVDRTQTLVIEDTQTILMNDLKKAEEKEKEAQRKFQAAKAELDQANKKIDHLKNQLNGGILE